MMKIVPKSIFISVAFVCCAMASYGQDTSATAKNQTLSYFKIEVGMHILDCPVLPPRLKTKLMGYNGIQDYRTDMGTQSILFTIPEGTLTKEQIQKIAESCDFPPTSVNVLMSAKPFTNK